MKKKTTEKVIETKKLNPLKFFKNKRGQGMLEYVLLLGAIVLVVAIFRERFKGMVEKGLTQVEGQATSSIGGQ